MRRHVYLPFLGLLAAAWLSAGEGKWTPQQMLQLDAEWLRKEGLELPPAKLWDPERGSGLLAAAVNTGGCSAAFVSPKGLVLTNHHCIFSLVQQHATPANDIITKGYLARTQAEELPGKSMRITVPRGFRDVTAEVLAAVPAGAGDLARFRAIEGKQKQLVAECEKRPATRCQVAAFDGGLQYVLIDAMELSDVRLVYAPPRAVGEYGGEVDNWMWPRHTGDFGIVRAYTAPDGKPAEYSQANVPYRPGQYFPVSTRGVGPGDFVMVIGYPGITYRSLTAAEMAERRDLFFTRREEVYGEWIRILEEASKGDKTGTIAVAARLKSLLNVHKNAQGQLAGFRRGSILEKQREQEKGILAWAEAEPKYKAAVEAHRGLAALVEEQRKTWERDFLLGMVPLASMPLANAATLVRVARERGKPDLERDPAYMERNLPRVKENLDRTEKSYFAPADKRLLAAFVRRALALPEGQRIAAIESRFRDCAAPGCVDSRVDSLFGASKVLDPAERSKMFNETPGQLAARQDPLLALAFALDDDLQALKERRDRWQGAVYRLRPKWREAVIARAGRAVAPDANGTLRVSFAHVQGYAPRDAVYYMPQTTLRGMLEKKTGEEPFQVPEALERAAAAKQFGFWKDPRLNDVPVNFLADADTTGGNSGSPTVNGRGELVGLNFDRVWENVANDFGYNPDIARNVNVDVRYLLWILDQVENAGALLEELGAR